MGMQVEIQREDWRRMAWGLLVVVLVMAGGPVLLAQAATTVAGSPLEPGQANESVVSFVWAYAGAAFLQWWKKSPFGGLTDRTAHHVKRVVAVATAFASAFGVHASFDAAAGVLTITGLTQAGLIEAVGDTIRQFVFQQFIYRAAIEEGSNA